MIAIRRAEERGHFGQGWADAYHTFSFDRYRDPEHTGFRKLLALNDERVEPGFATAHRVDSDVEILSYVVEGALEERDADGNSLRLGPGELGHVRASPGEQRDGFNPSSDASVRFLQFWLKPIRTSKASTSSDRRQISDEEKRGRLGLVASPSGRDGSLAIGSDAEIFVSLLAEHDVVRHTLAAGRHAWVQAVRGTLRVNGRLLTVGDGAAISSENLIELEALSEAEVVVFDLG